MYASFSFWASPQGKDFVTVDRNRNKYDVSATFVQKDLHSTYKYLSHVRLSTIAMKQRRPFRMSINETFCRKGYHLGRVKRIWYLSPMRAAKVQASLCIRTVSPEPPLLAHTSSKSRGTFRQKARSLAPLNGWACAVKMSWRNARRHKFAWRGSFGLFSEFIMFILICHKWFQKQKH